MTSPTYLCFWCCDSCFADTHEVLTYICLRSRAPSAISISSVPDTDLSVSEDSNIEFDFSVAALLFYKPLHTKMGPT